MKCVILCGGRGIIDVESRQRIPKACLQVGEKPLIWHVMKIFATFGFDEFVLALGEGGELIRRFFLHQNLYSQDVELSGGDRRITYLTTSPEATWKIKCIDTGLNAQTGSRVARCRRYLDDGPFFVTYSDCLANVNIMDLIAFHRKQGKTLTVTGVQPGSRFGTFYVKDDTVSGYSLETKLSGVGGFLNGGFMIMEPKVFDYLEVFNECTLEKEVFSQLARESNLAVYPHTGYWQAVDTERDLQTVASLYLGNIRPWLPTLP